MNESSNRSYSNPPGRDIPNYPESIRQQHNLHQQEYENFHRERTLHFKENENLQLDKYRDADGDRASLIKRINTLLVEVDRLNHEKNQLANSLHEERILSGEMQKKAKNSGKAKNIVDRNLQSDLKFEKEENSRLRHLLHQIEIERAELRSKLKDYELSASSSAYEKKELSLKIQQKIDHILILESDNRAFSEKVLFYQNRIADLEKENSNIIHDRSNLCDSISRLEIERSEIIMKLHEQASHNENFQISKNNEIENMKWIQKRHCRLLASRSIGLELEKITFRIYNSVLTKIQDTLSFSTAQYKGTQKIISNLFKYYSRRHKASFDLWRSQLNWTNTQNSRMNLVHYYNDKKIKSKLFADWRNLFLNRLKDKRQRVLCVSIVSKLFKDRIGNSLRNRFAQFKAFCQFERNKNTSVSYLTIRSFMGKIRSAMGKWVRFNEKMKELQSREDLATEFAASLVKARFFSAIKEYVRLKKQSREFLNYKKDQADKIYQISVLNELKRYTQKKHQKDSIVKKMVKRWVKKDLSKSIFTWKNEVKTQKNLEKIEFYLRGVDLSKSRIVKEKLFYAWKNYLTASKLKKVSDELSIEKPLREEYEANYNTILSEKRHLHTIKAARIFAKCFRGEVYSYFSHWKENTAYFRESKPRIKRMILKEYIFKVGKAFNNWKESVSNMSITNMYNTNKKYAESNSALLQHVDNLEEALSVQISKHQDLSKLTMKRVILRLQNFNLSAYLRTWAQNAFIISNKLSSALVIEKKLLGFIHRKTFSAIKDRAKCIKRKMANRRIIAKRNLMLFRRSIENGFDAWKHYFFMYNKAKAIVLKASRRNNYNCRQMYLNRWKSCIKDQREYELNAHSFELASQKDELNKNLLEMTENYKFESQKATKFMKNLKKITKLRLVNSLVKCSQGSRRIFWNRWVSAISLQKEKVSTTSNLLKLWNKNSERRAWRCWILYIKKKYETWSHKEITSMKKHNKAALRTAKEEQEALKAEIANKENTINECQDQIKYEERVKNFLLNRSVKHFSTEYSESRAAFAFKILKKRYLKIKSTTLNLTRLIQSLKKKYALLCIKSESRQNFQINSIRALLSGAFRKYSFRYLRNLFDIWHRNSQKHHSDNLISKIKLDTAKINELNLLHRNIKKNNARKMLGVLVLKSQNDVFSAWAKAARKQKCIRLASQKFYAVSKGSKARLAVKNWEDFVATSKEDRHKLHVGMGKYMQKLLSRVFSSWKTLHDTGRYFECVFGGVNKRYYRDSLFTGLSAIKKFATEVGVTNEWRSKAKQASMTKILHTKSKRILSKGFRSWTEFMNLKTNAYSKVRRAILRSLHRKFRTGFDLWLECFLVKKTVENVNKQGTVAIENSMLKDRNEILLKLIEDEGIDQKYVEKYINERENLKAALKRKGISLMRYKAGLVNPNDTSIIPRLFLTWKLWVIKRKRITKYAHRMLAYRKKSDLMKAFLTWKRGFPLVVNTISKLPRKELYGLVAKMDRDIKTLEGRLEATNSDLVYMNAYSEVLQIQTRRGQNLALCIGKNNMQKTYYRVFLRWNMHTNLCKVHDLLAQLTSVEENFYITKTTMKALEEDNQQMVEENLDLRQASLDGIAIAEAFETLSKERERLSVDLAERTATIKKLLDHNNELALRLKQFSNDEKFVTPERELYRTRKY